MLTHSSDLINYSKSIKLKLTTFRNHSVFISNQGHRRKLKGAAQCGQAEHWRLGTALDTNLVRTSAQTQAPIALEDISHQKRECCCLPILRCNHRDKPYARM